MRALPAFVLLTACSGDVPVETAEPTTPPTSTASATAGGTSTGGMSTGAATGSTGTSTGSGTTDPSVLVVTDHAAMAGYFSEWGSGDQTALVENSNCAMRAGMERGNCLQITYTRDPDGDGTGPAWAGWGWLPFATDPAADWGTYTIPVPAGATEVSFWAWGEVGDEVVKFESGSVDLDGATYSTGDMTLSATPTHYTFDISASGWSEVTVPFLWATGAAPLAGDMVFYVDDLVYQMPATAGTTTTPTVTTPTTGTTSSTTTVLSDHAIMSGYFSEWGGGDQTDLVENTNCMVRGGMARGTCYEITYNRDPDNDGAGPAWAGFAWLDLYNDPASDWALGPAIPMPAGASTVTFYAWGAAGGEVITFESGDAIADGFKFSTGAQTLTNMPTLYSMDISSAGWTQVTMPFFWVTSYGPTNDTPVTFYVDDVVFE